MPYPETLGLRPVLVLLSAAGSGPAAAEAFACLSPVYIKTCAGATLVAFAALCLGRPRHRRRSQSLEACAACFLRALNIFACLRQDTEPLEDEQEEFDAFDDLPESMEVRANVWYLPHSLSSYDLYSLSTGLLGWQEALPLIEGVCIGPHRAGAPRFRFLLCCVAEVAGTFVKRGRAVVRALPGSFLARADRCFSL